jgi:hypothetical protein
VAQQTVDISSAGFVTRLAASLRTARRDAKASVRDLARASGGAFDPPRLRALERGTAPLADVDLVALARLYRIDLVALLLPRVPLQVDPAAGVLRIAGVARRFPPGDGVALLDAYLDAVRTLRQGRDPAVLTFRRTDLEVLATALATDPATIVDRLGVLVGASAASRRSMMLTVTAGATMVVLATSAFASDAADDRAADADTSRPTATATAEAEDLAGVDVGGRR